MVTQVEIARRLGLDVSSVNKILNRVEGPKFKLSTQKQVFQVAKRLGYKINPNSKGQLASAIAMLKQILKSNIPAHEKLNAFEVTLRAIN